jgi:hypothetical protein
MSVWRKLNGAARCLLLRVVCEKEGSEGLFGPGNNAVTSASVPLFSLSFPHTESQKSQVIRATHSADVVNPEIFGAILLYVVDKYVYFLDNIDVAIFDNPK